MKWTIFLRLCVGGLALAAGGCASIVKGTTQDISVNSDPEGADCVLTREGKPLGTVRTPGQIKVSRDSRIIHVDCAKEGYANNREYMNSRYETMSAGNLVLGGLIGVAIDQATGATNRYDTTVEVHLDPLAPGQVAAPLPGPATPAVPPPVEAPVVQAAVAPTSPPPVFESGTWQSPMRLVPEKSRVSCAKEAGPYTFDLHDGTFAGTTSTGRLFDTTATADGTVSQEFKSPTGARLAITGNAKTRQLELRNLNSGCTWTSEPAA